MQNNIQKDLTMIDSIIVFGQLDIVPYSRLG